MSTVNAYKNIDSIYLHQGMIIVCWINNEGVAAQHVIAFQRNITQLIIHF